MRLVFALIIGSALGLSAWHFAKPVRAGAPLSGRYVEARTASVFAGACHYNGELVTGGREVLMAWHFDDGAYQGESLAGLDAVAMVRADENLKLADDHGDRRSVLYVPERASAAQRDALVHAVEARAGSALGDVRAVKPTTLEVKIEGESYSVEVAGAAELRGTLMADRACCTMPQSVWYEPMTKLQDRVVGNSDVFSFHDESFGTPFTRRGNNDSFVGRFADTTSCSAHACCDSLPQCCRTREDSKSATATP